MADVEPTYWTPSQWADDLGSLAAIAHQTPRIAFDLNSIPASRAMVSSVASSLFQSQANPYSQE